MPRKMRIGERGCWRGFRPISGGGEKVCRRSGVPRGSASWVGREPLWGTVATRGALNRVVLIRRCRTGYSLCGCGTRSAARCRAARSDSPRRAANTPHVPGYVGEVFRGVLALRPVGLMSRRRCPPHARTDEQPCGGRRFAFPPYGVFRRPCLVPGAMAPDACARARLRRLRRVGLRRSSTLRRRGR